MNNLNATTPFLVSFSVLNDLQFAKRHYDWMLATTVGFDPSPETYKSLTSILYEIDFINYCLIKEQELYEIYLAIHYLRHYSAIQNAYDRQILLCPSENHDYFVERKQNSEVLMKRFAKFTGESEPSVTHDYKSIAQDFVSH